MRQRGPLHRIIACFHPYWALSAFVIFLSLSAVAISLLSPLLLKEIIDQAIPEKNISLLLMLCGTMVVCIIVGGMLGVWQSHLEHVVGQRMMKDLRMAMVRSLHKQSISFFTQARLGDIIHRLTSDIQMTQKITTKSLITAITQSFFWLAAVTVLFVLDVKLAVFSILLLPLYVLPSRTAAKKRKQIMNEVQELNADMTSFISDAFGVSGALLTKVFGRESLLEQRLSTLNDHIMAKQLKLNVIGQWTLMFNGSLPAAGTAMIYLYGGYSIIQETMTLGDMVAFSLYLGKLYGPTQQLLNLYMDFVTSTAVFQRIFDYLDRVPDVVEREHAKVLAPFKESIAFRNVSFAYNPGKNILKNITFEVRRGQQAAIVGPSGAGKTTLIGLIARLYDCSSGSILIDGIDIRDVSLHSLRRQIAYVSQDPFLFHASIKENLLFASPGASDQDIVKACKDAYIHDFIQRLPSGYHTKVGERGLQLSGGERQRLAIARALLSRPNILILDEATSHLDAHSEAYVQLALAKLMKSCTTLVIAHRLSTIFAADHIIVLKEGKVAETGKHHELLSRNGLYSSLYRTQFSTSTT